MNIINFDQICDAIDEAYDGSYIGELMDIRDTAIVVDRRSMDRGIKTQLQEIRCRAERKVDELLKQDELKEMLEVLFAIISAKPGVNPRWAANEATQISDPDTKTPDWVRAAAMGTFHNLARGKLKDAFVDKEATHPLFQEIQFGYRVESGELVPPENMTDADQDYVAAQLHREAEALFEKAAALGRYAKDRRTDDEAQ